MCFTKKAIHYPKSKTHLGQICLVKTYFHTSSVTSVIIDSKTIDHFFNNQNLFKTYIKYKHKFETELGQKIVTHSYGNVDLEISDLQDNVNTLTTTNVS